MFDVLPPQRRAFGRAGFAWLQSPSCGGKSADFQRQNIDRTKLRILQALNQFDIERGWVAYLAPTRTLVRQVARRLRRDFEPLGVSVEQVSPALEVDGVESELLCEKDKDREFRVLVTTPEKLDLMLRQDWEERLAAP